MTEAITRAQPSSSRPDRPGNQPFERTSEYVQANNSNGPTGSRLLQCALCLIIKERGAKQDAGIPHKIIPLTFHFYGNCLSFLYSFTFVSFFFSFRPAAGIFLLFFMLLICVACWPVDCPDELDSWTNTVGERGTHGRPGWLAGCSLPFAFVCLLMLNLTIGQNIIFAAPSHIWRWITRGRALNAHWWTFFDLQMSAGANVMNPWWHCKERKQINTKQNQKTKKPKQKQKEKHIRNGH